MFNLLQGATSGVLSNQRPAAGGATPSVVVSPTGGNIRITAPLAAIMRLTDGERVVVGTGIQNLGGTIVVPYGVVSNPLGSPARFSRDQDEVTFIVFKGKNNSEDVLGDEYETKFPYTGTYADRDARSVYDAQKAEWVQKTMVERGMPADKAFGNIVRKAGTSFTLSSKNAWATLGGDTTKNVHYKVSDPIFGIAVDANGVASLAYSNSVEIEGAAYVFINSEATEENAVWTQGTFTECRAANPFFALEFNVAKEKGAARGKGASHDSEDFEDFDLEEEIDEV